ncbi:glycosyltransferase [Streptococcus suis]|uniref:glycosyltransferase n=1 Tax=Streptococcus suis TaxID=1307 RepID=UPI000CF6E71D|nr:glycosyltransferase [Streptococcus suis]
MNQQFKILMVSTVGLEKNGIHTWIKNYYCALSRKQDIKIDLIAPSFEDHEFRKYIDSTDGEYFIFKTRKRNPIGYMIRLYNIIKKRKYDAIHVHGSSNMMLLELLPALLAGCRHRIVHSHNTSTDHIFIHKLLKFPFKTLTTNRIACGNDAGKWLFGSQDFTVIRNGVRLENYEFDITIRDSIRTKLNISNKVVLGHVGGFNHQKNQRFLIELIKEFYIRDKDEEFHLLLIGDGEEFSTIQNLIESYGLSKSVTLLGALDNVGEYLQAIDIFVLPSYFEGLPFVLIEAQAAGLPIVSSDFVTKEVDLFGKITFLPLDVSKWCNEISTMNFARCQNPNLMRTLGYDLHNNSEQLYDYYSKIISD